jgi:hypothetical protein
MALLMLECTNDDIIRTSSTASLHDQEIIPEEIPEVQLFPFRVKHLGNPEVYVLFTKSENRRKEWHENIIQAKASYATLLQSQNAEPFSLSLVAHGAFQLEYLVPPNNYFKIQSTSLARVAAQSGPALTVSGKVTCATSLELDGTRWTIVDTNEGINSFTTENPRRVFSSTPLPHVQQICVIPKFNMLVVLALGTLCTYKLDDLCRSQWEVANGPLERNLEKEVILEDVEYFVAGNILDDIKLFCTKAELLQTLVNVYYTGLPCLTKS